MIQSTVTEPGTATPETTDETPLLDEQVEGDSKVQTTGEDDVTADESSEESTDEQKSNEPVDDRTPDQIAAEKEHRLLEDLRHYRKDLQKQAEIVSRRKSAWESSKLETADFKKSYEAAQEQLHEMAMKDTSLPLFNQPDDGDVFEQNSDTATPTPDTDDKWREASLDDLGITGALADKLADKLVDAELDTLGKISDYTSAGKQLTDIKGIGPEKAELISDACADYFASHPVSSKQPDDEQTTETDDSESDDSDQPESGDVVLSLVGVEDDDDDESPEADEDMVDQDDADNVEDEIDDTENLDDDADDESDEMDEDEQD
ncbi:MAG TPA: hypothetical protein DCM28_13125 [Phycisphaerales bacterium]|nr:hypothetical protein [Phycisphaerales bacterium]